MNNDNVVNINDATALINYLLNNDGSGLNLQNADCNENGGIAIDDATMLINYLLNEHW